MTSMPASRSARAMIFAPRSWPSRPGLATTTRILRAMPGSLEHLFLTGEAVLGGHATQHGGHRGDAGRVIAAGVGGDGEPPDRGAVPQRVQDDLLVHRGQRD